MIASSAHRDRGFTLIELLVAVAIVAIIGVMALVGLERGDQSADARAEREPNAGRTIQLAMRVLVQDLAQLQPRATREELGESYQPSLLASPNAQFALEFSRGGWANPAGLPRGTVLRVAYDWEEDKLVRWHWAVMDRTLSTPPVRTELLDGVDERRGAFPRYGRGMAPRLAAAQMARAAEARCASARRRVRDRARRFRPRFPSGGDERMSARANNAASPC